MPNRDVHIPVSTTAGAITAGICANEQPVEVIISRLIGGAIGGHLGGRMPDIIDPPKNGPNHRSIGHGIIPVGLTCSLGYESTVNARKWLKQKADESRADDQLPTCLLYEALIGAIDGFIAGYIAHLALDSQTPKGLPLLN